MNKKYTIIIILSAVVLIGLMAYYVYLLKDKKDVVETQTSNSHAAEMIAKNIDGHNYPSTPRAVVVFYSDLVKAYYNEELTEAQMEALGKKARKLFDEELKSKQTEEEFITALKADILLYNQTQKTINDCIIERAADNKYLTIEGVNYCTVKTVFYVKENKKFTASYMDFKLRQDIDGNWKILSWGLAQSSTIKGE